MRNSVFSRFGLAAILISASASAGLLVPGWAGSADPFSDQARWAKSNARLTFVSTSTAWNYYDVPVPIKDLVSATSLTLSWTHDVNGVSLGAAEAAALTFNADGTFANSSGYDATTGTRNPSVIVPVGGSALLSVRMKSDAGSGLNSHYISRVKTGGSASL